MQVYLAPRDTRYEMQNEFETTLRARTPCAMRMMIPRQISVDLIVPTAGVYKTEQRVHEFPHAPALHRKLFILSGGDLNKGEIPLTTMELVL